MTTRPECSHLCTARLPPQQGFDAFRSALGATHDAARLPGDTSPFVADLTAWRIDDLVVTAGSQSGCRMQRDLDRIDRDGYDHITFMLIRSGNGEGDANGPLVWGDGEIAVLDAREPMAVVTSDNTNIGVRLPRAHLRTCLARRHGGLHGFVLRGAAAMILGDHFVSLVTHAPIIAAADIGLVARSTIALIVSMLDDAPALAMRQAEALSLRERARTYAAARPGLRLSPEVLARELGVSRSSLYRAFGSVGGVSRHLRNQRLDEFRDALHDPAERRSIAQIAEALGFRNLSTAVAAYESRFGKTPSQDKRDIGSDGTSGRSATLGHAYRVWLDRLQDLTTA